MNKNELIVFDLDFTLWPFHVDECTPPFMKHEPCDAVTDSDGRVCALYPDVINILEFLKGKNYILAVASRPKNISGSFQLLQFFDIAKFFRYKEIYPGNKKFHFQNVRAKTRTDFERIVFFDNDKRNTRNVQKLGVRCFLVREEISLGFVCSALNLEK